MHIRVYVVILWALLLRSGVGGAQVRQCGTAGTRCCRNRPQCSRSLTCTRGICRPQPVVPNPRRPIPFSEQGLPPRGSNGEYPSPTSQGGSLEVFRLSRARSRFPQATGTLNYRLEARVLPVIANCPNWYLQGMEMVFFRDRDVVSTVPIVVSHGENHEQNFIFAHTWTAAAPRENISAVLRWENSACSPNPDRPGGVRVTTILVTECGPVLCPPSPRPNTR